MSTLTLLLAAGQVALGGEAVDGRLLRAACKTLNAIGVRWAAAGLVDTGLQPFPGSLSAF